MKKFFVISSQRSGTTWFCEKVAGMFGRNINWWEELGSEDFIERKKLKEYLLPEPTYINDDWYLRNLRTLEAFKVNGEKKYIIRKTENFYKKVYDSLEYNEYLNIMYDQCSINSILNYPVIHFIRRDSFAQAQSNFVAQKTGIFHSSNFYKEKIKNLTDDQKNIELNFDGVFFDANRCNKLKKIYFETFKTYHKNCLTIFYEDCLDEHYWKNILNEKLEKFLEDKIVNPEYKTEHSKLNIFNITNTKGQDWEENGWNYLVDCCKKHNLPVNTDSLSKLMYFHEL